MQSGCLCWCGLLAGLLPLPCCGLAISETSAQGSLPTYVVRAWQTEDGLPDNRVTAVVQTRDGYIWLGTLGGLARFDGSHFTVYDASNTGGLLTSPVTSLFENSRGELWIGCETGELVCYNARQGFRSVPVAGTWSGRRIYGISEDDAGDLWLVNSVGELMRVKDGEVFSPPKGRTTGTLVELARSGNSLWIVRNGAASRVENGRPNAFHVEDHPETEYVQGIGPAHDGGTWVANNGRIRKWRDGKWVEDRGPAPWVYAPLTCLIETLSGAVVAGTSEDGLFMLLPDRGVVRLGLSTGVPKWIRALSEDREGNIWVGTGSRGVVMLRRSNVRALSPPDHWNGCAVLSVSPGSEGGLWAGTDGAGVYHYRDGIWTNYFQESELFNPYVWSVVEAAEGRLWVATWGSGITVLQHEKFSRPPGLQKFATPTAALYQARDGSWWIGTSAGLLHDDGTGTNWIRIEQGLAGADVRAIAEDRRGRLWIGMFGGGLGCIENGKVRRFRKSDGLPTELVQSLHEARDGTLWIGTYGGGLCRMREGRLSTIGKAQGLPNGFIFDIEEDELGYFWMSTRAGVLRASEDELNQCADHRVERAHFQSYGISDGLPTLECSGGGQPAGCRTSDGWVWFATIKGIVGLNPADVRTNLVQPPVAIEKILVDDAPLTWNDTTHSAVRIRPGQHRIEFQYAGLSFVAPESVRFQYQLNGFESHWTDAGARRSAVYSYIPPGDYVLHVVACNNDGIWNTVGARVALVVLPEFWQTWWFKSLSAFGIMSAGGGLMWLDARRRTRRRFERLEREKAVERERARIAKDIHDDLGASLTRITLLSESERNDIQVPPKLAADLDEIRSTARELTTAMAEVVWAVNPQHDTLDSLITYLEKFGQEYLRSAGISCHLEVPLESPSLALTSEVRHHLFLAFKEVIHNVVKHAAASKVRIVASLEPGWFRLSIEDNGRGFQLSSDGPPPATGSSVPGSGHGLLNMRQRLAATGGQAIIQSVPGKGTRIQFSLPLPVTQS